MSLLVLLLEGCAEGSMPFVLGAYISKHALAYYWKALE